jgi:hypothetical protein
LWGTGRCSAASGSCPGWLAVSEQPKRRVLTEIHKLCQFYKIMFISILPVSVFNDSAQNLSVAGQVFGFEVT